MKLCFVPLAKKFAQEPNAEPLVAQRFVFKLNKMVSLTRDLTWICFFLRALCVSVVFPFS